MENFKINSVYPVYLNKFQKNLYHNIMKVLVQSQNFLEISQSQNDEYNIMLSYNIGYNSYNIIIYTEDNFAISIISPYEDSSLSFYESIDDGVIKKILNK